MGRPKLPYERRRLRLDGYLPVDDPLLERIEGLPKGTRFPTVMRWLRMGKALEEMPVEGVSDEQLRLQVEAAKEILDAFVVD